MKKLILPGLLFALAFAFCANVVYAELPGPQEVCWAICASECDAYCSPLVCSDFDMEYSPRPMPQCICSNFQCLGVAGEEAAEPDDWTFESDSFIGGAVVDDVVIEEEAVVQPSAESSYSGAPCPSGCFPGWPCLPNQKVAASCSDECVRMCADNGGECQNQLSWHCSATSGMVNCDWWCYFPVLDDPE